MSNILRVAALVAFIVGAVICFVVDAPDPIDLFAALFVGLACWVGSTLSPT